MNRRALVPTVAALLASIVIGYPLISFGQDASKPQVGLTTSLGDIVIELEPARAPKTVANFLSYVNAGYYDGLIFHRVIDGFMVQGGGFDAEMKRRAANAPIENEASNELKNDRGTLAMARTSDPHSATAQFFINVVDNTFLNRERSRDGWGYCVFGHVVSGMEIVDKIKQVAVAVRAGMRNVPQQPVVIERAYLVAAAKKE